MTTWNLINTANTNTPLFTVDLIDPDGLTAIVRIEKLTTVQMVAVSVSFDGKPLPRRYAGAAALLATLWQLDAIRPDPKLVRSLWHDRPVLIGDHMVACCGKRETVQAALRDHFGELYRPDGSKLWDLL